MCLVTRNVFSCMQSDPIHLYYHGSIPPSQPCGASGSNDRMYCSAPFFIDRPYDYACRYCSENPGFLDELHERIPVGEEPTESGRTLLRGLGQYTARSPVQSYHFADRDVAGLRKGDLCNADLFRFDAARGAKRTKIVGRAPITSLPPTPSTTVKVNPDPVVIRLLASLGLGFDCASPVELSLASNVVKTPSSDIIFAHPCKSVSSLLHARSLGVRLMTFDNLAELEKIKRWYPEAKLVLRLHVDDTGSSSTLSSKFGASRLQYRPLLEKAKALGLTVVGVSFHVGSGCRDSKLYRSALGRARAALDVAREVGHCACRVVDVGGGFDHDNFDASADEISRGLKDFFGGGREEVTVIAEPGRYFVSNAFQLAANVIAKREAQESTGVGEEPLARLYVNESVYGSFNDVITESRPHPPFPLTLNHRSDIDSARLPLELCQVFGQTCDSLDLISPRALLPLDQVRVGDWLRWESMGAYTSCTASDFNGFPKTTRVEYTIDGTSAEEEVIRRLLECPR